MSLGLSCQPSSSNGTGTLQLMTWFERSVFIYLFIYLLFLIPPVAMFIVTEIFISNTAVFLFTTLNM